MSRRGKGESVNAREEELIKRMQDNLAVIRKVGGWTTEQFGEEIGVTRQTVSNLEKGKTKLTKTQYLAIRAVLIHEIGSKENEALAQVVRRLVDEPVEEPMLDEGSEEIRPTESAIEDMSRMTEMLASETTYAIIAAAAKTLGGPLPSPMGTMPAIIYALVRSASDKGSSLARAAIKIKHERSTNE